MALAHSESSDGTRYRDLNGNGVMDPYEDPRLSSDDRADDLLGRLSLEEKAGLVFQTVIHVGAPGDHDDPGHVGTGTARELVLGKRMNHFNVTRLPSARQTALWVNALQELAEGTPHGIPVTLASDPRHGFSHNEGMVQPAGHLSQWPETLGLAAIGEVDLFERFADVARREYRALGITSAIHPQIDLATDPRWARQLQTFGQDPAQVSAFVAAYLRGFQGQDLSTGVACIAKHFPGGGAQKDGEDPHFPYGREQVYPGGRFDEHLAPFRAAIFAGVAAVMPYYGMPVGLTVDGELIDEVGFAFNRAIITDLLRSRLHFDGVVVSDWAIISDIEVAGKPWPAKAWGVEHLSIPERVTLALQSGVDQIGGETLTEVVVDLVQNGTIEEEHLNQSVRRILLVKFRLGLFDNPYVEPDTADAAVGTVEYRQEGHNAQARSITILKNEGILPLPEGTRLYCEGMNVDDVRQYGVEVVDKPEDADVAVVRLAAPYEPRDMYFLEAATHQGSLDFDPEVIAHLADLASRTAVIADIHLERAAILTPIAPSTSALVGNYGASDRALLDALFGRIQAQGTLPMELPSSMTEVLASYPDVPSDTGNPLFPVGHSVPYATVMRT
ncbi:beta-glucosidase [Microbacterium sp. Root166]|uniref:glycoside hydrolase family 3 protein n=1 Tax=Microbacterium sp. Root166 TaxID=1736478 RepID=UPI0006F30C30|nr:glycoside hydrolase family 3 N-terminal domain-containing protein [Microbacterium sp. Root166]KQZ85808.1 beta-glucosidase [Microbacterium sp. Root166]